MSPSLERRLLRTIREHALVAESDRVAVALSGGPDSVALLLLLSELEHRGDLPGRLAGVIHVHHGLRGEDADEDERFCGDLARRLNIPIESTRCDVAGAAAASGRSREAVARDLRYAFFEEAARRLGATAVATGHTADDQAETVLLRLLRGAGGRGLGGIRIRRGLFIRPLLNCRRRELRAYLAARGEMFREDRSNLDLSIPRNRVRHTLLPVIEDIAPGGVRALARFAALAAADERYLDQDAIKAAESVVLINKDGVQLTSGALSGLPPALARRVVRRALETVAPGRAFSSQHLLAVLGMLRPESAGSHLDLPGVTVERAGDVLAFRRAVRQPRHVIDIGETTLPVPGRIHLADAGVWLSAARRDGANALDLDGGADTAFVREASVAGPLRVRSRRPGDRFRPFGAPGHRKVQDLLVDRKVPRSERDAVPVVVDATGRIIWVAGIAIAEECRVTSLTEGVVVLKLERRPS